MIAHVDADAFFASVLQRKFPRLRGKPLLALGMGGGCVIAASYEAKAFGVKTGMRLSEARKLVPDALIEPSDFKEACIASRELEQELKNVCPVVERMSVDEWYLDLASTPGGIPSSLNDWAAATCNALQNKTHLSVSMGVGPSKLLAKMASEYRKPAGITLVGAAEQHDAITIEAFLRDRPAAAIPGIGRRRSLHAEAHAWSTAWDIATADVHLITKLFGRPGKDMQQELNGTPMERVTCDSKPPKSISRCRSFPRTNDRSVIRAHLMHHLTYVIMKMRRADLSCSAVAVWMRDDRYVSRSKDAKIPHSATTEERILPYVEHCFARLTAESVRCTQIGMALLDLKPVGGTQYSLFDNPSNVNEGEAVQEALDDVHARFGRGSLTRASALPTNQKTLKKRLYTIN